MSSVLSRKYIEAIIMKYGGKYSMASPDKTGPTSQDAKPRVNPGFTPCICYIKMGDELGVWRPEMWARKVQAFAWDLLILNLNIATILQFYLSIYR
jgi:hypothetical protein